MYENIDKAKKVIGIFQHNEILDINFYNMAFNLSQYFTVYAFILNQNFNTYKNIEIKNLTRVAIKNYRLKDYIVFQPKRVLSKLGFMVKEPLYLSELAYLINKEKIRFDFLLGIEKKGLALMSKIKSPSSIKIYYSLELYDKPYFKTPYNFDKLKNLEVKYHSLCDFTIIQDTNRAICISEYNRIDFHKMKWIYLPVSVKGGINMIKSKFLYEHLNIDINKKIILNFGMIDQHRQSVKVAGILNKPDSRFQPVFHVLGEQKIMNEISLFDNIILSRKLVRENELNNLISSAYIGISIYTNDDYNDKLTILSSEKNARFCQNGIPFVCLFNEETDLIYKEIKYFEMVENLEDIPAAIEKIYKNYSFYRQNAFNAFERYYSFDNNFKKLLKELN